MNVTNCSFLSHYLYSLPDPRNIRKYTNTQNASQCYRLLMFTDGFFLFFLFFLLFPSCTSALNRLSCAPQNTFKTLHASKCLPVLLFRRYCSQCPPPSPCFWPAVCGRVGGVENPHTKDVALSPTSLAASVGKSGSGARHWPRGRYRALGYADCCVQFWGVCLYTACGVSSQCVWCALHNACGVFFRICVVCSSQERFPFLLPIAC